MALPQGGFYVSLGSQIREARRQSHLTQDELAGVVGLTRTSITNIERGRQPVSVYALVQLSSALGREPGSFLVPDDGKPSARVEEQLRSLDDDKRRWITRIIKNDAGDGST